ncbi:MAG: MarR family transcriptional regulator [Thermoflexales bacterium]
MGRKPDSNRLQEIARYVERHPRCKPIEIARQLDLHPSTVTRLLPALEEAGILLSEDSHGRLFLFGKRR